MEINSGVNLSLLSENCLASTTARSCMNMLERRICKSSIRLETNLRLYQTLCQFWCMGARLGPPQSTKYLLSHLDAFDTLALRKILRLPHTRQMSNAEVRRTTGCSPLSHLVTNRRLRLFGHIARSSPREDHHRALASCIRQVYRPTGSDQQEDLATLGSVQLRQTLALWTLASRLPGERPLLETNGDILWTQQCSSGVCSERKRNCLTGEKPIFLTNHLAATSKTNVTTTKWQHKKT